MNNVTDHILNFLGGARMQELLNYDFIQQPQQYSPNNRQNNVVKQAGFLRDFGDF